MGSKTVVNSSMTNMFGKNNKRTGLFENENPKNNILKTTILSHAINPIGLAGDHLTKTYLEGPGIGLKSWKRYYDKVGYKTLFSISDNVVYSTKVSTFNYPSINSYISTNKSYPVGSTVTTTSAGIVTVDLKYIVNDWLLENHPEYVVSDTDGEDDSLNYSYGIYTDPVDSVEKIYIYDPDLFPKEGSGIDDIPTNDSILFKVITDLSIIGKKGIAIRYEVSLPNDADVVNKDPEIEVIPPDDFDDVIDLLDYPKTSGDNPTNDSEHLDLDIKTRVTKTYSDGRDPVIDVTVNSSSVYNYTKTTNSFSSDAEMSVDSSGRICSDRDTVDLVESKTKEETVVSSNTVINNLPGGAVETVLTEEIEESAVDYKYYVTGTLSTVSNTSLSNIGFLYVYGSGSLILDSFIDDASSESMANVPPIILRTENIWGTWFVEPHKTVIDKSIKKLFQRNLKLKKIITTLNENETIRNNVQFVFIEPGVPLNSILPESKKYIFKFFENILESTGKYGSNSSSIVTTAVSQINAFVAYNTAYVIYQKKLHDYNFSFKSNDPPPKPPSPVVKPPEEPHRAYVNTIANGWGYYKTFNWSYASIEEVMGSYPGLELNHCTVIRNPSLDIPNYTTQIITGSLSLAVSTWHMWKRGFTAIQIIKQLPTSYKVITVWGLDCGFSVKNGVGVNYDGATELLRSDISPMLVPLHELALFEDDGLINITQIARDSFYYRFNSYQIIKTGGWFKRLLKMALFIVIAIVVVSFGLPNLAAEIGTSMGSWFGGTTIAANITAGTLLSVQGLLSTFAIVAANMVISTVVTSVLGKALGANASGFFAIVMAFVSGQIQSIASGNFSFSLDITKLMTPTNLMSLSMSTVNNLTQIKTAKAQELAKKTGEFVEDEKNKLDRYTAETQAMFSSGIDMNMLNDMLDWIKMSETPQNFLDRTLLKGSDIVNLTHNLVHDYVSLTTPKALPKG